MLAPVSANNRTVVGIHACREVLKVRPKKVSEIWLRKDYERQSELVFFAEWGKKNNKKVTVRDEGVLNKIATSHQGVAVLVSETPELDLDALYQLPPEKKLVLLALDEITDAHNIGAILRTAWLMGAKGLLVPEHRAGHLTPGSMKVASGGAEHVPLLVVKNLQNELKELKDNGFWIYGLAGEGQTTLTETRFNEKVVLVIGSEEKGIRSSVRGVCDELVKIPQANADASYNASVAAAIVLYETNRQHHS
jgi:23S rRNA (guanosine2251-2'-O)-methyltransferase